MQRLLNWWDHVTWAYPEGIALAGIVALGALGVGGYFVANALSGGNAMTNTLTEHQVTTALVPATRTVNGHVVRFKVRRITHYTPIYRRVVRTIDGKTITTRKLVGRRAVTVSRVVTTSRTSTVRGPGQTVTAPGQTVAGPGKTVTAPGRTVVVTQTVTESRTETNFVPTTVTDVVTTTIPVTVTVTVTIP